MQFRGRMSFPKFDAKKWSDHLQEEVQVQLRQAARAWLRAVLTRVPVWAGTSQGSLKPLGRAINVAVNPVPVAKFGTRKDENGIAYGEAHGKFSFKRDGKRFIFTSETMVKHFIYNNDNDPRPFIRLTHEPVPWKAFQLGDEAFQKYIDENFPKRVPPLKNFITYKTRIT